MSARIAISAVANAIVSKLRLRLTDFVPALKLVQLDEYWSTQASIAKLGERMPCIIVSLRSIEPVSNIGLAGGCVYNFDLNYFIGMSYAGSNRTTVFENLQMIAETFTDGDFSDSSISVDGLEIAECRIGAMTTQPELMENNIAWGVVSLSVEALSL